MKLFEKLEEYDDSIASALHAILKSEYDITIPEKTLQSAILRMGLSDILSLDVALEQNDKDTVTSIIYRYLPNEYAIPGRTSVTSTASNRSEPAKQNTSSNQQSTNTTSSQKNVSDDSSESKKPNKKITTKPTIKPIGSSSSNGIKTESLDEIKKLAGIYKK